MKSLCRKKTQGGGCADIKKSRWKKKKLATISMTFGEVGINTTRRRRACAIRGCAVIGREPCLGAGNWATAGLIAQAGV